MKKFIILFVLLLAKVVFAGDASQLKIIGFSADGKYLAVEVSGVQDGSGIPYCEIYFIDVEKNDFAARALKLRGKEFDGSTLAGLQAQAASAIAEPLQNLQIDKNNQGQMLSDHPLSDLTSDGCHVRFSTLPGIFPAPSGYQYDLYLEQKSTGEKCFELETKIFALKLKQGEKTKILQQDRRLPASRGCVYKYRIERVVLFEKKIAVFLNLFKPGFEGPDIRHMVVTGSLAFADGE